MKESKATIDLRSDTVTKQNQAIKDAMYHAQAGDYAYGEDLSSDNYNYRSPTIIITEI